MLFMSYGLYKLIPIYSKLVFNKLIYGNVFVAHYIMAVDVRNAYYYA